MRIAFLTPEFVTEENYDGGLSSYLGRVTTALAERGHQVEVFVTSSIVGKIEHNGVIVHRIPPSKMAVFSKFSANLENWRIPAFSFLQSRVAVSSALDRALRTRAHQVPFDIVQITNLNSLGLWVTKHPVAPVVMRISSFAPYLTQVYGWPCTLERRTADWLELFAIRKCRWRYAPSQVIAHALNEHLKVDVEVIEPPFIFNQTDLDINWGIKASTMAPYLLHYGTLGRLKGSGVLARIIPSLLNEVPDLRCVLAGKVNGKEGESVISLASLYPDRVKYLGVLKPEQLYPVIQNAKLVVLPSLIDNLPNTCIEAMGMEKVVIGTNGASFEQLIEDRFSGFLVEQGCPQQLKEVILKAWRLSPSRRQQIGKAAQNRIEQLHPDKTIPKLENFFHTAIWDGKFN
jgi:glycogen synthase